MSDDIELLRKWRDGDASAGQVLFRRHTDTLRRFFHNKAATAVEDLVQETMLACLQSHNQYQQRSSFRTYLLGVARHQLFDFYRRSRTDATRLEFTTVSVHDLAPSPSLQAAKAGEERVLLEALRRLPIDIQIALELSYWEDLTGPELAEILEVPVDTAYSRLRRARQLLKEQLQLLATSGEQLAATQTNLARWANALRHPIDPDGEPPNSD